MRSMVVNLSHAFDQDLVDRDPLDQRAPFRAFDLTLYDLPCCHKTSIDISPTWKK